MKNYLFGKNKKISCKTNHTTIFKSLHYFQCPQKKKSHYFFSSQVARYSVNTGHPYFVNQLFSSVDPYGLVGQWLTDALNPSVYTFEVAPVFTLMEEEVLREMRAIVGWAGGEGDGIFCPGGSLSNGYAISCARYFFYPEIKVRFPSYFVLKLLNIFVNVKQSSFCLEISPKTCRTAVSKRLKIASRSTTVKI